MPTVVLHTMAEAGEHSKCSHRDKQTKVDSCSQKEIPPPVTMKKTLGGRGQGIMLNDVSQTQKGKTV